MEQAKNIIIGSGPAGMGCAISLAKANRPFVVLDRGDVPGGLCRTINFNGYYFDIGGHRFISKSQEVLDLWNEVMDKDMLSVSRLSRIYYRKKYFNYPLSFMNTFWNLGPIESLHCIASYAWCKKMKPGNEGTFEGWIINHFGRRLYEIFFRTYTEKVWEVACRDISAEWAKQRIRGLSLKVALKKAIFGSNNSTPKTLCDRFLYPRRGPGEMYRRMENLAKAKGGRFEYGHSVKSIHHHSHRIESVVVEKKNDVTDYSLDVDHLFSSIPLPILIKILNPPPPGEILAAAVRLRYRSFIIVNIVLNKKEIFPDQWIYIHSPDVKLGRVQNYKNWSPTMVADINKSSLGLEYFCSEGDEFWKMNDEDMIDFAVDELQKVGIVPRKYLINGFVVRCPNVYPVYSLNYQNDITIIRNYLEGFNNFQTMGRHGLFRYCNSDHALLTGIYAARNFLGEGSFDLWSVNADETYLES